MPRTLYTRFRKLSQSGCCCFGSHLKGLMTVKTSVVILLTLMYCRGAVALEPGEILVVANKDIGESVQIAQYYCGQRGVPDKNILALPLGAGLKATISRDDYDKQLAGPIRHKFFTEKLPFGRAMRTFATLTTSF